MGFWIWFSVSIVLIICSAILTYALTRLRVAQNMEQQRQALANALAALEAERHAFEERARGIEETARRKALDDFLAEMRIEERHYVREHRLLFAHRKSLVLQERMFFRNIPLSAWVEHEVPVEEGTDIDAMAKTLSVFKALEEGHKPVPFRNLLM